MFEKIVHMLYYLINILFITAISITLYGVSKHPLTNPLSLTNVVWVWFVLFIVAILFVISIDSLRKFTLKAIQFLWSKRKIIGPIVFIILMIYQFIVLRLITTSIGWDVGRIFTASSDLLTKNDPTAANLYLSMNPNNSFFFFMMHGLASLAESFSPGLGTSWLYWQTINTLLLDFSIISLFWAIRRIFNEESAFFATTLASLSLMISPWILVPYTDILSFFIQSILLLLGAFAFTTKNSILKSLYSVGLGLFFGISFLIKPTNLIVLIAIFIIIVLKSFEKHRYTYFLKPINIIAASVAILTFLTVTVSFNYYLDHQTIVTYDESKEKVYPLFIMMGLKDDGGYDSNDSNYIVSIPDREQKFSEAFRIIDERLTSFKDGEYSQFLLQKHFNNTDRGDFGWGKDGIQQEAETPSVSALQHYLRDTYYQKGSRSNNLRFYMQIMWIITLVGILFTFFKGKQHTFLLTLKLVVIGTFLYLLIFEGGRSRYLIQFLPLFYTLAGVGWNRYLVKKLSSIR